MVCQQIKMTRIAKISTEIFISDNNSTCFKDATLTGFLSTLFNFVSLLDIISKNKKSAMVLFVILLRFDIFLLFRKLQKSWKNYTEKCKKKNWTSNILILLSYLNKTAVLAKTVNAKFPNQAQNFAFWSFEMKITRDSFLLFRLSSSCCCGMANSFQNWTIVEALAKSQNQRQHQY